MSERTLWLLATVSRSWPWESRDLMEDRLGARVALARDEGCKRFVLVHGAYGLYSGGSLKYTPPKSDAIARQFWVREWGFEEEAHFPDYKSYGRAAPQIRNSDMVRSVVEHLLENPRDMAFCEAFIVNGSAGATKTAELAERAGIRTRRTGPGKATSPLNVRRAPKMALVPRTGEVVPVKSRRPVDPRAHRVPNIPGPCGRCGQVAYLATDNVLFHGDGQCGVWDEVQRAWVPGCGSIVPLRRPERALDLAVEAPVRRIRAS